MNAITINLDQLKALMIEFIRARGGDVDDDNLLRRLTLSDFLLWLRQKENYGKEKITPSITSTGTNRSTN